MKRPNARWGMKNNLNRLVNLCVVMVFVATQALPAWGFAIDIDNTFSVLPNSKPDGKEGIHEKITADAIHLININANQSMILNIQRGTENIDITHQLDSEAHFDNNSFQKGFDSIQGHINIAIQNAENNPEFFNPHNTSFRGIAIDLEATLQKAVADKGLLKHWEFPSTAFEVKASALLPTVAKLETNINPDPHNSLWVGSISSVKDTIDWALGPHDCKTCDTMFIGGKKHYNSLEEMLGANHWLVKELKMERDEIRAYIAFEELGHAFHTTQDFFAHSNYIELMTNTSVGSQINTPVLVPSNFNQFKYVGIQNLIKANPNSTKNVNLESGYFDLTTNYCNRIAGNSNAPGGFKYCHYHTSTNVGLNKDGPKSDEPSHVNHLYAKDAATYVSALLWADFLKSIHQNSSLPNTAFSNRITTVIPINNPILISPASSSVIIIPRNNIAPAVQDCLSYDPNKLKIVNEGANGWLLTDGRSRMLMLDNQNDANAALAMAKQYTSQCFIGRNNNRPNRKDYIVRYWGGNSGIVTTIPNQDCISYNTAKLSIKNEGANGWLLTDGRSRMLMLDNEQDAKAALEMAKKYTQQCFIGRNNKRPNRKDYIIQYWK